MLPRSQQCITTVVLLLIHFSFAWPTMHKAGAGFGQSPSPQAPIWKTWWSANWTMVFNITSSTPPYAKVPSGRFMPQTRGTTYYDWTSKSMTEVYYDGCIPIFPDFPLDSTPLFPCSFVNGPDHVAYIVTGNNRPKGWPGPCCVFAKPWYPPAPSSLQMFMAFDQVHRFQGRSSYVYKLLTGELGGGWFYYEFFENAPDELAAFHFPGMPTSSNLNTYVGQFYTDFLGNRPLPSMFLPPASCSGNIPTCPIPGGVTAAMVPPHNGFDHCQLPPDPPPQAHERRGE